MRDPADGAEGTWPLPPIAGTRPYCAFSRALGTMRMRYQGNSGAPFLRSQSGLGEIMLQVFYAPKSHDALAFCSTPAKRLDRFVPSIQIWVERSLSLSPLLACRTPCRVWCEDCGGRGGGGVRRHYLQRQEISLRYMLCYVIFSTRGNVVL